MKGNPAALVFHLIIPALATLFEVLELPTLHGGLPLGGRKRHPGLAIHEFTLAREVLRHKCQVLEGRAYHCIGCFPLWSASRKKSFFL
jgi:hypothetical protein